jgi:Ca-activated chloride channel homolog
LGLVVGHVTSVSAARRFTLALLLAFVGTAARADTWNDLWATREQQAQQLLESKKAAEAAPLFSDPRRRAYAELEAGQYAKAAEHLAPFKDADSQYNRGNALAHTGKLQDALAAYDGALAQSPGNQDMKRNRDLVAQALKQQSQQGQQQAGGNSQSDKQGKGQPGGGQSSPGANGQGDKGQDASKQGSQGQQANRDQPGNPSQAANGGQTNKDGQSGNQSQPSDQGQQANQSQAPSQPQPEKQAQAANQQQPGSQSRSAANQAQAGDRAQQPSSSAAQGNRAADDRSDLTAKSQGPQPNGAGSAQAQPQAPPQTAAQSQPAQPQTSTQAKGSAQEPTPTEAQALAEAGQRGVSGADPISAQRALAGANAAPQLPRSEQALALDQWLRGIPEDSGELLRRKFMIEHMMKQQGNEP